MLWIQIIRKIFDRRRSVRMKLVVELIEGVRVLLSCLMEPKGHRLSLVSHIQRNRVLTGQRRMAIFKGQ